MFVLCLWFVPYKIYKYDQTHLATGNKNILVWQHGSNHVDIYEVVNVLFIVFPDFKNRQLVK